MRVAIAARHQEFEMTMQRMNLWGYSFEPETGRLFDDRGRGQPYTFQFVTLMRSGAFADAMLRAELAICSGKCPQ